MVMWRICAICGERFIRNADDVNIGRLARLFCYECNDAFRRHDEAELLRRNAPMRERWRGVA
jgi:hypothetical protein